MVHVESSAVTDVAYRIGQQEMRVRFASGEWYAYQAVPETLYRRFLEADSKGRFFQDQVRDRFAFIRLN